MVERGRVWKNASLTEVLVSCIHVPSTEIEKDNKQDQEEELAVSVADFLVVEGRTKLDERTQNNIKHKGEASAIQHSLADVGIKEGVDLACPDHSRIREMPPHAEENNKAQKKLHKDAKVLDDND